MKKMKVSQSAPNVCEMVQNDVPVWFWEVLDPFGGERSEPGGRRGPGGAGERSELWGCQIRKKSKKIENFKMAQNDAKCLVNAQK